MKKMAFEWNRIHKWEERIENDVTESVYQVVCEFYGIDEVDELTPEQLTEVVEFRDELNEYSVMQIGFSNLISYVEGVHWENEQEEEDE